VQVEAGVLDGDRRVAEVAQHPTQQHEPLRDAGGDDRPLRIRRDRPRAPQIGRQGVAEFGGPARIGVAERPVGHLAQRAAPRGEPRRARECRQVGPPRQQVVLADRLERPGGARLRRRGRARGDPRRRSLPRLEVALGRELRVGLEHDPARHRQLARERARGRQGCPGDEPPGPDRVAQRPLDLPVQRSVAPLERQQQVRRELALASHTKLDLNDGAS
jgi:hypothetical protein